MTIILYLPELTEWTADASVRSVVVGSLIVGFLLLALGFGALQMRRMKKSMDLLDDEARARRAHQLDLEEELCSIGAGPKRVPQQMKDPWQS